MDIRFAKGELVWRISITAEGLPTTKRVEIIEVRFLDYVVCQCNQGCKYNTILKKGGNGYPRSMA